MQHPTEGVVTWLTGLRSPVELLVGIRFRVGRERQTRDHSAIQSLDAKSPPGNRDHIPDLGYAANLAENVAAYRVVDVFGEIGFRSAH